MSSWMTTPSVHGNEIHSWYLQWLFTCLMLCLGDEGCPVEEGWRKDCVGHPPVCRGQIPYLTLWIHLRESLEKSLRKQGGLYLPPDPGQLLIPLHEGQTVSTAVQKLRSHLFHARPVSMLDWVTDKKGFHGNLSGVIFGIHQDFQPFTTVTKRDVSWVYTLEENYSLAMSFWGTLPPQMEDSSKQASLSTIRYTRLKLKAEETFTTYEKGKTLQASIQDWRMIGRGKKNRTNKNRWFFNKNF